VCASAQCKRARHFERRSNANTHNVHTDFVSACTTYCGHQLGSSTNNNCAGTHSTAHAGATCSKGLAQLGNNLAPLAPQLCSNGPSELISPPQGVTNQSHVHTLARTRTHMLPYAPVAAHLCREGRWVLAPQAVQQGKHELRVVCDLWRSRAQGMQESEHVRWTICVVCGAAERRARSRACTGARVSIIVGACLGHPRAARWVGQG